MDEPADIDGDTTLIRLGEVARFMSRSKHYASYPTACIAAWIEPAVVLNQIHLFRDGLGEVVGYVTWAFLSEDAEHRLLNDHEVLLHLSEWNEGDRLWILDFVLQDSPIKPCVNEVFAVLPQCESASSLRRRDDGSIRKRVRWTRKPVATSP